jgi:hypothetical protein
MDGAADERANVTRKVLEVATSMIGDKASISAAADGRDDFTESDHIPGAISCSGDA